MAVSNWMCKLYNLTIIIVNIKLTKRVNPHHIYYLA